MMADDSQNNECLVAAALPTGRLCLEYQPHADTIGPERREVERHLRALFTENPERACLALGLVDQTLRLDPSVEYWRDLSAAFVHELLVDPLTEQQRGKVRIALPDEDPAARAARVPPMAGAEYVTADFIREFWELLHRAWAQEAAGNPGPAEPIVRKLAPGHGLLAHRVHFHLVENRRTEDHPFAFLATYAADTNEKGALRHLPLGHALQEFGNDTHRLVPILASVHQAAGGGGLVKELLDSGEIFHPLKLTAAEAYRFLREVPRYEQAGILCRIPRWWNAAPRKIAVSLSLGNKTAAKLDAQTLIDCAPQLHIDGEPISPEEAQRILAQYDGLALIKGKWTVVDRETLQKNLALFAAARKLSGQQGISLGEAVRMLLGMQPATLGDGTAWGGDVRSGNWLAGVMEKLRSPATLENVPPPRGLRARLRPYQQAGLNWLTFLHQLGFGACLADDMGLGKTIQALALLQAQKERGGPAYGPSLLVVPASLIDNWLSEIGRFTPGLRAAVAHPQFSDPAALRALAADVTSYDIVITTYTLSRKLPWIARHAWHYLILDEAQAIKNPGAAQTRAVKELTARHRLIMTGTPIENRLGDLWSLFDFVNRGLLGSAHAFRTFAKGLETNPAGYGRLRRVLQPYILRRLKTDKSIISDLPEKVEMTAWASLSRKQTVLYQGLVADLARSLDNAEGIQRKGLVLSFLLKFKQLCNHPDQLTGAGPFAEDDSGKFARLRELCEAVREKRERVLVFTQFREMVGPLDDFCRSIFGQPGVQLHGGTGVAKRKQLVAAFQSADTYVPYFVLSVKAGGLGLNLTAANHVVHFDRWWNPAVERQAEDRAFRIGQKRNVMVHKFVCKGTVEEKIDAMIAGKKELANQVLAAGTETWLTEMSNEQLRNLFTLTLKAEE
jgi:non-specific serine/threonine protein kinase